MTTLAAIMFLAGMLLQGAFFCYSLVLSVKGRYVPAIYYLGLAFFLRLTTWSGI